MINKGYTKVGNIIFTNKETIINTIRDFENIEIESIENFFHYKIIINDHNNFWSITCNDNTINIIEKVFICYNIWKLFKHNIIIRVDPKISNKIVNKSNIFIKKNRFRVKVYQAFNNSTIIFVAGDNKNNILDTVEFITCIIDNYSLNIHFIWVNFSYFINTLRYIFPKNLDIEKDLKIKISNFDNSLIFNENKNKKRICIIGLSNNFHIIWSYIKNIVFYEKMESLKNIEYLNIEMKSIKKIKNINKEKVDLISRKIKDNNIQILRNKKEIPNNVYSTSL